MLDALQQVIASETLGEVQLSGFTLRKADASLFPHAWHLPISD
jgi:hypothetical protein